MNKNDPTILDILGTSTPVSEILAEKLGYVKAAIACRVFFYQQLRRGVCDASIQTLATKLGMSTGCIATNLKWLMDNGYIQEIGEHKKGNVTNSYKVTAKFYDALQRSGDERNVQEMNVDVHEVNGEEESKEELKKESTPTPKKQNGKTDILTDIVAHAQKGVSEITGPNPDDQWFEASDEFIKLWQQKTARYPNDDEKAAISKLSTDYPLEQWELALTECNLHYTGHRLPVARAIEVCKAGGTWAEWCQKQDEKSAAPPQERRKILDPRTGEWTGAYYT